MTSASISRAQPNDLARSVGAADVCTLQDAEYPATPLDESKRFATLRARAALIGFALCTITETDGQCFYLVGRWGMTRTLPDLAAVSTLLRQAGAPE